MASATRWADLGLRAASAAVLIPLVLACLWFGGLAWQGLLGLACVGLAYEWRQMCRHRPGALSSVLLVIGWAYFASGALALARLRGDAAGFGNVLYLLLLVWGTDIGAYLVGRAIGGARLAPAISPGKTWSGAVGGLLAALAIAWGFGASPQGLAGAAVLSVAAQIGDLAESAAKRYYGLKDSGQLIPGHGGLFDRVDGLLAAAPIASLLALMIGAGQELWR